MNISSLSLRKNKIFFIISIFLCFVLLEILLRIQQKIGPFYDLEFKQIITLGGSSDILNHVNPAGEHRIYVTLGKERIKYKKYYDSNGIRVNKLIPHYPDDQVRFKILFMGDSFMEGFGDADTIPYRIWQSFQHTSLRNLKINFLNSGCASYSPAIFIPQAKLLIPLLKPDLVVIDIDETDLMDDYVRYKDLIVRNNRGEIIAVKHTPIHLMFIDGFMKIKKQPLYLTRLFLKFCHTRLFMPIAIKSYHNKIKHHIFMDYFHDLNKVSVVSKEKYREQADFFKKNIEELAEVLINSMGNKKKILFIYHSYFLY